MGKYSPKKKREVTPKQKPRFGDARDNYDPRSGQPNPCTSARSLSTMPRRSR